MHVHIALIGCSFRRETTDTTKHTGADHMASRCACACACCMCMCMLLPTVPVVTTYTERLERAATSRAERLGLKSSRSRSFRRAALFVRGNMAELVLFGVGCGFVVASVPVGLAGLCGASTALETPPTRKRRGSLSPLATSPGSGNYSLPITRNWKTGVCNYSNYSCNYNTAVITATETRLGGPTPTRG